jgi:hypothetical protein
MGYSWNDFDRTYEMGNLIEKYADERVKQALNIDSVGKAERTVCFKCGEHIDPMLFVKGENNECGDCHYK